MAEDEDPSTRRTDEVTRERERYSTESTNVGVVSWIDTNGGALCPRLPLVIAKPRRARFSPFLSCRPLVLFAPIRPPPADLAAPTDFTPRRLRLSFILSPNDWQRGDSECCIVSAMTPVYVLSF